MKRASAVRASLISVLLGLVGCEPARHEVDLLVDRAACTTTCAKPRFELYVHEKRADGRCTRYATATYGDLLAPELSFAPDAAVVVGVSVICEGASGGSPACCAELKVCIDSLGKAPECKAAALSCPKEADPFTGDMKGYYAASCSGAAGPGCVECFGEQSLRLSGAAQVSVSVSQTSAACGSFSAPAAPACP